VHAPQVEAYSKAQHATMSGREAEAAVLMKGAALLRHVQAHWSSPERDRALELALRYNQRLWTFFQVALLDEDNPLPRNVKEGVLRLSAFVDKRIFDVLAYPASEKLDILIAINSNIAAGLKASAS
jgi:flagellar biosynthesis activator protein FlaF